MSFILAEYGQPTRTKVVPGTTIDMAPEHVQRRVKTLMEMEGSDSLANIKHLPINAGFVRSRLSIHHTPLRFFVVGMLADQSNIQLPIQTGAVNQYVMSLVLFPHTEMNRLFTHVATLLENPTFLISNGGLQFASFDKAPVYDCRESLNFAHITSYPRFGDELGPGSIVVAVFEFRVHRSSLSPSTVSLDTKFVAVLHDAPIIHEPSSELPDITI
ncbi:hypothetical protein BC829DRAFT_417565 [Chytridium lagenaria]|nr:hypothetical protein BC829DRAFT_417565 [Chytridium lagenaria]